MILEALLCLAPLPTFVEGEEPTPDNNRWYAGSLDRALVTAEREDRPVLLYFWVPGSGQCADMYESTIKADAPVERMRSFLLVSVDSSNAELYPLFEQYSITTVPAVRVLDDSGAAIDGMTGNVEPDKFVNELTRILDGEGTLSDLTRRVAEDPSDLELQNLLAGKYQDLGDQEKHDEIREGIKAADPEGRSKIAAQLILQDVVNECRDGATGPDEVDLARLVEHIGAMPDNEVVFTAWQNLSAMHSARGEFDKQIDAMQGAWAVIPDDQVAPWGSRGATWLWLNRDALKKKEKAFALDMATKALAAAEKAVAEDAAGPEEHAAYLAHQVTNLARCQYMNEQPEDAIASMRRAVELLPEHDELAERLALYEAGSEDRSFRVYADTSPVWSPDGRKLLFVTNRHSDEGIANDELYSVAVSNGKEKRLTRSRANENGACWGPKGKTIAFTSDRYLTNAIYVAKADGSKQTLFTRFDPDAPTGTSSPCYSPDGKHIAFETYENGKSEIAVMDTKGKTKRILTADTPKTDMAPVWTADSKHILYMSNRAGDADVYQIAADGSNDRNITNAPKDSWDMDGELSPKGDRIVFSSWRSGTLEIYTCEPDGSDVVCLTNSPETEDRHPRWSPNGKKIAFDRKLADGSTRIYVMNADGSKPKAVTGIRG